jgi:hypothetical protein
MKVGKHSKCFFEKNHFKTLESKIDIKQFRQFIRKIHLRICNEAILSTKEGYVLPHKLGDIRVKKEKKKEGVFTTHSVMTKNKKEFNHHTFGYVYSIVWDKNNRYSYFHKAKAYCFPNYKNQAIYWFQIYKFTPTREYLKRALAKKIFSGDYI